MALSSGLAVVLLPAVAGASPVVLNEVLYDPDGADAGLEFVELAATLGGAPEASLAGWTLETGNGARPGEWTVAWIGRAGDRLRGGLFVVGESGVEPRPDAVADLDLQNGPDACRLRGPAGAEDRLGWGEPLAPALAEGTPAPDVSGQSLARRPDGLDTGDNARDFRGAPPSPGAFNSPELALAVEEFAAPPASARFAWTVRNVGRRAAPARVRAVCRVHPGEILATAGGGTLAPGAAARLEAPAGATPGTHLPESDPPAAVPAAGGAWRGPGPDLIVSEVLNRPRTGGTEWVELQSLGAAAVDLGAFGLADAAGGVATLAGTLAAGGWAVAAADTAALRREWALPPGVLVVRGAPWPALNHTGSPVAERVGLRVASEETAAAALPGGAAEGVSWEASSRWRDPADPASWGQSLDPAGGTPGRPNSRWGDRAVASAAALVALPSPFRPARDGAALLVFRAPPGRDCRLTVHDSAGRRVATLAPWRAAAGEHRALWDGRVGDGAAAAPLGLYVVRAEAAGAAPVTVPLVLVR